MMELEIVAEGLKFPEGPVAMPDGSVIWSRSRRVGLPACGPMAARRPWRRPEAGPTGWRWAPDGKLYCCNNGGFNYIEHPSGLLIPHGQPEDYSGGRIERIDIATGAVELLYESGDFGCVLKGPNDIVFDAHGGFWFSDHARTARASATSPASSTPRPTAAISRR
jgi:gluconolactonase